MKTQAIAAAALDFDADGLPFSAEYGDIYHPRAGAMQQARHVFLAGNDLPGRWRGRAQFTVLELGFGLGNNFLATWAAWRADPDRCARLSFVSIEQHPLTGEALARLAREPGFAEPAQQLAAAWPPLTPNLHHLSFEGGRIELLLALGDVQSWLPQLTLLADAFYLDGFAPARNPRMWDARVCKALARLAAPEATLATWTAAQSVRTALVSAGFALRPAAGAGGKRDITLGRYAPVFTPRRSSARSAPAAHVEQRALIVGGGLAGTATAWALAERGWHSVLVERHGSLAAEASGNPGGIFHGTLHRQDGPHARLHRAGALAAAQAVRRAVHDHGADGAVGGLLRLEPNAGLAEMRTLIASVGLPADYVQAVDATAASALAGVPLAVPAWHYPDGGWVHPAGLARSFIERGKARVGVRLGLEVERIVCLDGRWQLLDAAGRVLDEAQTLVLANAGDALRLLDHPDWPLAPVRGQISLLPASAAPPGLAQCQRPVAGAGYLLPATSAGLLVFGATSQAVDADSRVREADSPMREADSPMREADPRVREADPPVREADSRVREADQWLNLARLARLSSVASQIDPAAMSGRTAFRWVTGDRLPLIGAVPARALWKTAVGATPGWEQPRRVPREPGLFVFIGLGSRGIGWSALGARTLAAAITGTPCPLEADLLDAIDPARFVSRAQRAQASLLTQGAG